MLKQITVIGTDSTHCVAFARLLKEREEEPWQITAAVRDSSSSLRLSQSRYPQIEAEMEGLGVTIFDTLTPGLAARTDAFIIASVDASLHVGQYQQLAPYGKAIFIDKPLAYSSVDMEKIFDVAEAHDLEVMSSSSLRFSESILEAAELVAKPTVIDLQGPLPIEPEIPGMFWYGIHLVELLLTICPQEFQVEQVRQVSDELIITCHSSETRCRLRGDLKGRGDFKGQLSAPHQSQSFNQAKDREPLYAYLVKEMLAYFETGLSPVSKEQTRAVIALVEKINQEVWDDYIPQS